MTGAGDGRISRLRQVAAVLVLPVTVTVVVPFLILRGAPVGLPQTGTRWAMEVAGGFLMVAGVSLVVVTVEMFRRIGNGSLAPWDPTRELVAVGVYRYVRNPMITGVMAILAGEALLFASAGVAVWALVFTVVNMLYMPLVEEPGLRRRFGSDYEIYAANVPRWIPKFDRGGIVTPGGRIPPRSP